MSTTQHSKSVLLTLLGTLTFTLSTLPEMAERMDQSSMDRQPAEVREGNCPLDDLSENGKVVDCEFTGKVGGSKETLSATVTVRRTKKAPTFVKKFLDDNKEEKAAEPEDAFEIRVQGIAVCEKCNTDVRTEMATRVIKVTQYNDVSKLRNFIEAEAKRKIEEARTMAREERKQREAQERCEVDESNENLTGRARMDCRVEKIAGMDEEKAADYFQKYLKNDLFSLMQSTNSRDVVLASQILGKLNSETSNAAVRDSVQDMVKYGQFTQRQNQMISNIAMLQANDPRRYALAQQLYGERQQANAYFQMRGMNLDRQNQQALMTDSWLQSITPAMIQDVNSYSRDIDARYNAIIDRLRVTMDNSSINGSGQQLNPTTSGRTLRGQPLAPGGQYSTVPSSGNVTTTSGFFNGPTFNGQTPLVNGGAPARMIPQAGQPVSPQQLQNRGVAR